MCSIQLSKRLIAIASFLPNGTYFADIGTDHAYLACYVCINDKQARAIASDVHYGPYSSAQKTVEQCNLHNVVDVRHGDGLSVLYDDSITELVIAGMGGSLIKAILESGKEQMHSVERIIIQPNAGEAHVRKWLIQHGYPIEHEVILEENNQIYEIIVADRSQDNQIMLSDKQLYFGPHLLNKKSDVFLKKWQQREQKLIDILQQLQQGKTVPEAKMKQFHKELSWVKEVLENENNP